jgi:hypothetical protein
MPESRKRVPEQGEDVVIYLGQTAVHACGVGRGEWSRRIHCPVLGVEHREVAIQWDANAPRAVFVPDVLMRRIIRAARRDQIPPWARLAVLVLPLDDRSKNTSGQTS